MSEFAFTYKQLKALELLRDPANKHVLLAGGARSGKTYLLVLAVVSRAAQYAGSRHLIARLRFAHAKLSIWMDTLQKVLHDHIPKEAYTLNETDHFVRFANGSEVWIDGLDDKDRVDKILGREYCLDPKALVLTANLDWVKAEELLQNDGLVGFPEDLDGHMCLERSVILRTKRIRSERYRVVTNKGETIVSADHRFVAYFDDRRTKNFRSLSWRSARDLRAGDSIRFASKPWENVSDYDHGWLAGMFDGEGWISAGHVGVSQKPGKVLDRIKKLLNEYGMSTREHDNNGCFILVAHNLWESMKLLGVLKPLRLFGKAGTIWEGRRGFNGMGGPSAHGTGRKAKDGGRHVAKIISVESIGEGDVIAVETSTKTLIADGFLGHNCTVYFNEVSQLPYDTVTTVLTRLSQNIPGCRNMAYYDCNPAGRLHWANKIFLHGELPDGKPCGPGYAYLKVNPEDNRNNLPPRFIEDILERLPEQKRKRFLLGEWTDPEGTIFTNWDVAEITEEIRLHSRHTYGLDFGFSVDPAVLTDIYVNGDDVWIDELVYETQLTNDDLGEQMKTLIVEGVTVWADCAEPKSIEELRRKFGYRIEGALKGPDSVRVGIDWLLAKRIHVTGRSANLQMELANYTWKTTREGAMQPEPIDDYNHAIDSIRYGCSEGIGEPQRVYQEPTWSAAELGL